MAQNVSFSSLMNPFVPLNEEKSPSFTAEKILIVVMPIIGAGCIVGVGALFFTFGSGTLVLEIALGSTASLSGSMIGMTLYHVHKIKWRCLAAVDSEDGSSENSSRESESSSSRSSSVESQASSDLDEGYESDKSISFRVYGSITDDKSESIIEESEIEASDDESLAEEPLSENSALKGFLDWYFELPEKNHIVSEAKENLRLLIEEHWDFCAEGYPAGTLEADFLFLSQHTEANSPIEDTQKLLIWMRLIPFFLRFFEVIGDKRTGLLIWAQENSSSLVEILYLHNEFKMLKKLSLVNQFLFDSIITMFMPFNDLFKDEGFAGREYLFDLGHRLFFETAPQLIKLEKPKIKKQLEKLAEQEKTNRENNTPGYREIVAKKIAENQERALINYYLVQAQSRVLFPHLSSLWEDRKNIEQFLKDMEMISDSFEDFSNSFKKLEDIKSFFSAFNVPTSQRKTHSEDFFECIPTIETLSRKIQDNYQQVMEDATRLIASNEDEKKRAEYADLFSEYKKMSDEIFSTIGRTFGDSVSNPADYFIKSSLLSSEIANLYPSIEDKTKLVDRLLKMLIQPLKTAKIDTKDIEEYSEELLAKASKEMSEFSSLDLDGWKLIPFHDVILFLLVGIHLAKNFHKILPWLSNRKAVFIDLICDTKIEAIINHKDKIKWLLGIGLAFLKPINWAINSQWVPKKSSGIRLAVDKSLNFLKKDELNKLKAEYKKSHPDATKAEIIQAVKLSPSSEALYKIGKPVLTFLIVGFFGSKDYERKAMGELEGLLTQFYQKLYTFDPRDKDNLKGHIQECLDSLFT